MMVRAGISAWPIISVVRTAIAAAIAIATPTTIET